MDFSFTEEQSMLRDTLASYLADNYDFEKRRAAGTRYPRSQANEWPHYAKRGHGLEPRALLRRREKPLQGGKARRPGALAAHRLQWL